MNDSWLIFKIHYVTENYITLTKGDISVGWKEICDALKSGPIFRDTNCQNWSHCPSASEIVRQMGMSFDSMTVARQFNEIWPLQCVGGNTPVTCQLFDFLEWCQKFHWQVTLRLWPWKIGYFYWRENVDKFSKFRKKFIFLKIVDKNVDIPELTEKIFICWQILIGQIFFDLSTNHV